MINKKSIGIIALWIYLMGIGFVLMGQFFSFGSVYAYIIRGTQGRSLSAFEDAIDYIQADAVFIENVSKREYSSHLQSLVLFNTKTFRQITCKFLYLQIMIVISAAFYFLSGVFAFLRSKKCKIYFNFSVSSVIIGLIIFWFFNHSLFLHMKESIRKAEDLIYLGAATRPPSDTDILGLASVVGYIFHSAYAVIFFIIIPKFGLSRKMLEEQLK